MVHFKDTRKERQGYSRLSGNYAHKNLLDTAESYVKKVETFMGKLCNINEIRIKKNDKFSCYQQNSADIFIMGFFSSKDFDALHCRIEKSFEFLRKL